MTNNMNEKKLNGIFILQVISLSLIWIFVILITFWIINLLTLSVELNDAPGATLGISLVAIPIFFTLACLLTYVFIGLHKK